MDPQTASHFCAGALRHFCTKMHSVCGPLNLALSAMKIFTVIMVALIVSAANADECSPERSERLQQMIGNNALGENDVKHGKLVKFTHHDYSISCEITLESGEYRWFTDKNENRFIIEEKTEGLSNYYGLFK